MAKGKGRVGTHTTLIEAARPVVKALERHGRVSRGFISARVGASTLSIKVKKISGGLCITVVSKGSRQDLHVYDLTTQQVREILEGPEFDNYRVKVAND